MNVFSANQPLLSAHEFETAADSSIIIVGFSNEVNRIEWQVYGNSTVLNSGVLNQQFARLEVRYVTRHYAQLLRRQSDSSKI